MDDSGVSAIRKEVQIGDCVMTGATSDDVWPLVRDFHYSKRMPSIIHQCFAWRKYGGLFGDRGEPVAAAIYGQPVNRAWPTDALELQRLVRSDDLKEPLSQFLAWTVRWIRSNKSSPFVISYADSGKGHHGGIYQASGWHFVRETGRYQDGLINKMTGEFIHGKTCFDRYGSRSQETLNAVKGDFELAYHETKYLYVFPLRQRLSSLMKRFDWTELPYPKPNAARPADAPVPTGASEAQPLGAAPNSAEVAA